MNSASLYQQGTVIYIIPMYCLHCGFSINCIEDTCIFHNTQLLSSVCPLPKPAINLQGKSWKDHLHGGGQAKQELEDDTNIREGTKVSLQSHSKPSVSDGA